MLVVPLQPVNSQYVTFNVSNQPVQLQITQRSTGLFVDVYLNNALLMGGILARNAVPMLQNTYLGFEGDLAFYDTQATNATNGADPYYTGLGSQFLLVYLAPGDLR